MAQTGKETLTLLHAPALTLVLALAVVLAWLWPGPLRGAEPAVVTDPLTGAALGGYDAVSYFDGTGPVPGSRAHVVQWAGGVWYFASAANRDAFAEAPAAYAPRFGGHGAMAMARGYLSSGNPLIFSIHGDTLFLFYSVGNREAFRARLHDNLVRADAHWAELASDPVSRLEVPGMDSFDPDAPMPGIGP